MDDVRAGPTVVIPAAELTWRFSRSSGAGGQHVNTTDSRVELSWDLERSTALTGRQRALARRRLADSLRDGVLTVVASERRSQLRNREAAMTRLGRARRRGRRAAAATAPPDEADEGLPRAPPRRQAPPERHQAPAPATDRLSRDR